MSSYLSLKPVVVYAFAASAGHRRHEDAGRFVVDK